MTSKTTKKTTSRKPATRANGSAGTATTATPATTGPQTRPQAPTSERVPKEDLVVFAFRLTQQEREAIHQAAGPAKASRFVRALTVAASSGDKDTVVAMLDAVASQRDGGPSKSNGKTTA